MLCHLLCPASSICPPAVCHQPHVSQSRVSPPAVCSRQPRAAASPQDTTKQPDTAASPARRTASSQSLLPFHRRSSATTRIPPIVCHRQSRIRLTVMCRDALWHTGVGINEEQLHHRKGYHDNT